MRPPAIGRRELVLMLACVLAVSSQACVTSHRGHPIVDPERGWCSHNACARLPVKAIRFASANTQNALEADYRLLKLKAEHREVALAVDREINALILGNESFVANYNACAIRQSKFDAWCDRFARALEIGATVKAKIILQAYDDVSAGSITPDDFETITKLLLKESQTGLVTAENLEATSSAAAKNASAGSESSKETGSTEAKLNNTKTLLRDILAAAKTGETKGGPPESIKRLRQSSAGAADVSALLQELIAH